MSLGRCVKRNYGYLGCSVGENAVKFLDSICSGRRQCSLNVFDNKIRALQPCPDDLTSYLEVSYSCLTVATGSQRQCQGHHHIQLQGPSGFIATVETEEHDYGSINCPWKIDVSAGQRINVTLYNFARYSDPQVSSKPDVCYEIAEIRENSSRKRVTLCDALGRETSLYISKTSSLVIQFVSGPTLRSLGAFLLEYKGSNIINLSMS